MWHHWNIFHFISIIKDYYVLISKYYCTETSGACTDLILSTSRSFQSGYLHTHSRDFKLIRTMLIRKKIIVYCLKKVFSPKSVLAKARTEQLKTCLCPDRLGIWPHLSRRQTALYYFTWVIANHPLGEFSKDSSPLYFSFPNVCQTDLWVSVPTLICKGSKDPAGYADTWFLSTVHCAPPQAVFSEEEGNWTRQKEGLEKATRRRQKH